MSIITTPGTAPAWSPDAYTFDPTDVLPDALLMQVTTVAGVIEGDAPSLRVAIINDAAATFVDEGATIPEADPELNEAVVQTRRLSLLTSVSREQYHQPGAADRLATSVARSIANAADTALIAQPAPTPPAVAPATGLAHWPGIQKVTEANGLAGVIDAAALIEEAGGNATTVIASPTTWAGITKAETSATGAMILGAGTADAPRQIIGRPVIVNRNVPAGQLLVVDSTAVVSAAGAVEVTTSEDGYAFNRNAVGIRALWRIGHAVIHPDRIALVTLA